MRTVLELLKRAGGWHPGLCLKIDSASYMELVIEAMDESGPCGLPAISVAHYGEVNGDLMRDPEMCFELGFAGGPQWSRFIKDGNYCYHTQLHEQHQNFAKLWDKNLDAQRFAEAFTDKCILG